MPTPSTSSTDDAAPELLAQYRVLCYVGEHPRAFPAAAADHAGVSIYARSPEATAAKLTALTCEAAFPCRLEGDVQWAAEPQGRGGWQLVLLNPRAVTSDFVKGEQVDPRAVAGGGGQPARA